MNKFRFTINAIAIATFTLAVASMAQAQATRTWVSGVGDDVNPCSRTAPCKTFAGAISKTAAGGEIDCLDGGGFGAVTITKSITLDGAGGFGSILHSGVNGIIINDTGVSPPTGTVTIKRLSINGAGTTLGTNGIRILSEKHVNVIECKIFNDSGRGISDERTHGGGPTLFVQDTTIHNVTGDGVHVGNPTSNVSATYDNVKVSKASVGIFMANATSSIVRNCTLTFNNTGVQIDGSGSASSIISSALSMNSTGLSNTGSANTRLTDSTITHNGVGISVPSGTVIGSGNNTVAANSSGNAVSSTQAGQ
jgi:hypothetical protein